MTGAELKAERMRLHLSQADLGYVLRADERTVRRWELDERAVPGLVDDFLEALRAGHLPARITGDWRAYLLNGRGS